MRFWGDGGCALQKLNSDAAESFVAWEIYKQKQFPLQLIIRASRYDDPTTVALHIQYSLSHVFLYITQHP